MKTHHIIHNKLKSFTIALIYSNHACLSSPHIYTQLTAHPIGIYSLTSKEHDLRLSFHTVYVHCIRLVVFLVEICVQEYQTLYEY